MFEIDLFRKKEELAEFRRGAEVDVRLGHDLDYIPPHKDDRIGMNGRIVGWPHDGGARYRYFIKRRRNGTISFVNPQNTVHSNLDTHTEAGRPFNPLLLKGYVELNGQEILDAVDEVQAASLESWDRQLDELKQVAAAPTIVRLEDKRQGKR